ncbi:MAG: Upf1 family helicase, partial [Candidatus Omnitrophica bacterium]|nr:Upf1 family helicase [Candidatus Omnitrophota bacterium]
EVEIGKELLQRRNEKYAEAIVNFLVNHLFPALENQMGEGKSVKIGIITPYNNQLCTIYKYLKKHGLEKNKCIKVGTVHSFQGEEADIIIFDTTDVDIYPSQLITDKKLINVALSRAKELLIIVGSKNYLTNPKYFKEDIRQIYKRIIEEGEMFVKGRLILFLFFHWSKNFLYFTKFKMASWFKRIFR